MRYSVWILIFILAGIVFANRYFFLEPNVKIKIPPLVERLLKYSAPCLLSAICAPIIFCRTDQDSLVTVNPYLVAAIITIILAMYIQRTMLVVLLGLCSFYLLLFFMPS